MNTNYKLALAGLAGLLIGVAGASRIHAQEVKTAPGYVIAEVEVTDPIALKKYGEKAPAILASYNGRYVVRGGEVQPLEGEPPKGYVVVMAFDSVAKAREWYDSPEYKAIRAIRQSATKSRIFIAEGVAPQ
ncbi:MAG: DUF1330 domain-containing protein [Terriglobales bacterium]|jgi:uncharacterized protein (DUF1330 family)